MDLNIEKTWEGVVLQNVHPPQVVTKSTFTDQIGLCVLCVVGDQLCTLYCSTFLTVSE